MTATITLIRHGQSRWQTGEDRSLDAELSVLGHDQSRLLGGLEAGRGAGVVVLSSPLRRARQTAGYLGGAVLPPAEIWEPLREADFHIGSEDGSTPSCPPSARYLTYRRAVEDALKRLEDEHVGAGRDVVAVTHNGFIKCLLRAVLGRPDLAVKVPNCSVTTLRREGTEISVEIGRRDHVPPALLTY